jgi:hypothetical protein
MFGRKKSPSKMQVIGGVAAQGATIAFVYGCVAFGLGFGNWVREGITDSVDDFNSERRRKAHIRTEEKKADELLTQAAQKQVLAQHGEDGVAAMTDDAVAQAIQAAKDGLEKAGLEVVA